MADNNVGQSYCTAVKPTHNTADIPQHSPVDLTHVIKKHDMNIHVFANDRQLYQHCLHDEMTDTIVLLEQYLTQALSGKDRTLLGGFKVHCDHARQ